ncbi:class C beta-lactamase [Antrihabitans stalactiti]|uniref:Beta-lactamase n=1 Tax=Antrihabitans stalactiti TaxID=2584121 RepID=A0A848K7Q9_9NOCA|nr:class C beta-lactamase [Antrihabitans stalactiti]NMN95025.1 beta-lactamase [Antrihabitans stalactiti]
MAIVFVTSCSAKTPPGPQSPLLAAVDAAVKPLLDDYGVPGVAVGVIAGGRQYFFVYGYADESDSTKVTAETIFEIGSVSETFTATLAGYAQAMGRLSLNDHPGEYVPALRGSGVDAATLINLGTNTAGGLPAQIPDSVTDSTLISYFEDWTPTAEPGEQWQNSNPSIGLLGYLTGKAMKKNFADTATSDLLPKLGLRHTFYNVPEELDGNYAWGYDKDHQRVRVNPGVLDSETYGVKSTVGDMLDFVQANIDPGHLDPAVKEAVEATHTGYYQVGDMVQGLGWEQYPYPVSLDQLQAGTSTATITEPNPTTPAGPPSSSTFFDMTGTTNGFSSIAAFVPDQRIGLVMLSNKNFPTDAQVTAAHAIFDYLSTHGN